MANDGQVSALMDEGGAHSPTAATVVFHDDGDAPSLACAAGALSSCPDAATAPPQQGAGKRRRVPLDTGKRRLPPAARLAQVLRELVATIESDYQHVYGHNLGVQSGTAALDDLVAQRMHALCSRVQALVAHDAVCADALAAGCAQLEPRCLNRVHSIFDSFDMHHVSDYIRLCITGHADAWAAARAATARAPPCAPAPAPWTTKWDFGSTATRTPEAGGAMSYWQAMDELDGQLTGRTATAVLQCSERAAAGTAAPPQLALRYQALRDSQHPFITVVDNLVRDKRRAKEAAATQAARAQREDRLAHLLAASKLDDLGVHLHHVLKHYPHIRAKWLAGESLLSLLDERKCVEGHTLSLTDIEEAYKGAAKGVPPSAGVIPQHDQPAQSERPRTKAQRDIFRDWGGAVPTAELGDAEPPQPRFEADVLFMTEKGAYHSSAPRAL